MVRQYTQHIFNTCIKRNLEIYEGKIPLIYRIRYDGSQIKENENHRHIKYVQKPNAEFQDQSRKKKGRCCDQEYQQLKEKKQYKENRTWFNKTREIIFTYRQEYLGVIMKVFIRGY